MDIRGLFFESFVDFMAGLLSFLPAGFFDIFFEDFLAATLGAGIISVALSAGALFGKRPKLDFLAGLLGVNFDI